MTPFSSSQRYFLYRAPADMRKGFDGLCGLVRQGMGRDPLSGDVFVFVNRRRTHVKLLVWDRSGLVLFYKRLEEGTFELPKEGEALAWRDLMLMLEGVSLEARRTRKRYRLPEPSGA